MEQVAHHAHALRRVDEVCFKTDQAAHRHEGFHGNLVADVIHVRDLRFATGKILHDRPQIFGRNFHEQFLDGFERIAGGGVFLPKHFRTRHQNFVTLAAHLLDENRDLHFAATADRENLRVTRLRDPEGDVGADFLY